MAEVLAAPTNRVLELHGHLDGDSYQRYFRLNTPPAATGELYGFPFRVRSQA